MNGYIHVTVYSAVSHACIIYSAVSHARIYTRSINVASLTEKFRDEHSYASKVVLYEQALPLHCVRTDAGIELAKSILPLRCVMSFAGAS